jgi:adenylate cyclase
MGRPPADRLNEEFWRDFLTIGDPREKRARMLLRRLPSDPRCRMCAAPFAGVGASVMRLLGKRRSTVNPTMCISCYAFISQHHGGAEIEMTLLFADIRGSTGIAESRSPVEFRALLDRFYSTATSVVFDHDGGIDKFVGDEVVAIFFPLLAGERHAERGVAAAQALLRATGHDDPGGPWAPLGVGVHTGPTWMGAVGEGNRTDLTVVGDTVNTASRLAGSAAAGEILVSDSAARAAGLDAGLERRQIEVRGRQEPIQVVTLRVGGLRSAERSIAG